MELNNFVKYALEKGGSIHPLIIPTKTGTGLMNPSIWVDPDGKIRVVLRHVNYTFYHSENKVFLHPWGPLTYLHPENDMHLRTENYYLELDPQTHQITRYNKIDMSFGDTYEPIWEFVGLEDARIMNWDGQFYICGVRRDTTTNGQGRMELCGIEITDTEVKEISRFRIPPPNDPNSYCEKNWMPVLDMPFHFVKWSSPTEVVKVDPISKTSETVTLNPNDGPQNRGGLRRDIRGGSQVVSFGPLRLALTHEVDLFKSEVGRKDAVYHHRFLLWDKDWNIVNFSKEFHMMDGHVEFCIGMARQGNDILLTYGFQDNAAYLLRVPMTAVFEFINSNK